MLTVAHSPILDLAQSVRTHEDEGATGTRKAEPDLPCEDP